MTRPEFHDMLMQFFRERGRGRIQDISAASNLFDLDVIDSVAVVDLILYLEKSLGRSIATESMSPRVFHTLDSMYDALCAPAGEA